MTLHHDAENSETAGKVQAPSLVGTVETPWVARPFQRGGPSPNPRGRPRGSNRHATVLGGALRVAGPPILKKMVALAKDGDVSAARYVLDRCLPRERLITLDLPRMRETKDALAALDRILNAAAVGAVTPAEAAALTGVVGNWLSLSTAQVLEERLAAVESRLAAE